MDLRPELKSEAGTTMSVRATPDQVAVVEFDAAHEFNPFSRARMRELAAVIERLDAAEDVGGVVLYGGEGRSFAAGGDFNETSEFADDDDVDAWIDDITDLYVALSRGSKPLIAAVDGYAIGVGLQIALCCDYRIGSERAVMVMPELKLGIACTFGGFMLESSVGRSVMQSMVFSADQWQANRALADGLLHETAAPAAVLNAAVERAAALASWTSAAVRGTRPQVNERFVEGLEWCREAGKRAHRAAFAAGEAQERMRRIISRQPS